MADATFKKSTLREYFESIVIAVILAFFIPTLGVQMYAIPGRLNRTWVKIDRPGVYYGQCNQICGLDHSFMPIAIEARASLWTLNRADFSDIPGLTLFDR